MRLGKEESTGFIEEPVEVSPAQQEQVETDPRPDGEPTIAPQRATRNASEDQPTSIR